MDKEASLCALAALKRDATEEDNFKLMVLFQQCSNRLREVEATGFCAESFKETGSSSAWEATTILLKKKIISKSKKGSSEFYTLTEKGEELADLMGADEEDSWILINDLKLIGIEAAFMQKAIVRAFRSKASLVETLRERETVEQKMNVLRQTPLDDSRVIPRYICSKLIDHFVP